MFIGDDSRDCQAAYNSGCKSIFVGDKNELKNLKPEELPISDHNNLLDAVPDIINFSFSFELLPSSVMTISISNCSLIDRIDVNSPSKLL